MIETLISLTAMQHPTKGGNMAVYKLNPGFELPRF
jgi:hypothetical protein